MLVKVQKSPGSFGFNLLYDRNGVVRKINYTTFLFRKSEKPNKQCLIRKYIYLHINRITAIHLFSSNFFSFDSLVFTIFIFLQELPRIFIICNTNLRLRVFLLILILRF